MRKNYNKFKRPVLLSFTLSLLTLLLTACGSPSGGGSGASGSTAPLVKAVGYLVTANGTPYTYTGPLTSTAVSATGGPASGGGNTASASLPTNGMLSCSNAIVNTTTVPGKFLFYAFFIADSGGEAYVYTYELDPTNGSLSLIGTQSWANPSNSCPSTGQPVFAAQKNCLFLSTTEAVPINSDGTVGSMVNPGEANPGNIEYLLSTDSTGNFLLASVNTQSGSCTPTTCLIYSYQINSNCAISSANVGQVSVPNLPNAPGYILPNYNTLLVFDSFSSQVEQYIVSNTGALTAGGTLPVTTGMTVDPIFVSPDDKELYLTQVSGDSHRLPLFPPDFPR